MSVGTWEWIRFTFHQVDQHFDHLKLSISTNLRIWEARNRCHVIECSMLNMYTSHSFRHILPALCMSVSVQWNNWNISTHEKMCRVFDSHRQSTQEAKEKQINLQRKCILLFAFTFISFCSFDIVYFRGFRDSRITWPANWWFLDYATTTIHIASNT